MRNADHRSIREATMIVRATLALLLGATSLLWQPAERASAQAYPNRPVKVVVPFPAGGPTDATARIVSDRLGQVLGQSIVIENRGGGAGGSVGAKVVASADPDGYTILMTPGGSLTTGPAVHKNIGYDPEKAFVPVCQLIETPLIISVHPSLPVKSMAELVSYAKANPGKVSWGSQGFGVAPHLLLELFKLDAGVNILHVPYRGTAPLLAAITAGEVQVLADPMTTSLPLIQGDKMRPIAIAGNVRTPKLPNVPTVVEAGFPKLQSPFWLGVVAPAGTPQAIVDKLNSAFRDSLKQPDTQKLLANLGADIKIGTPADFGKMLHAELTQWTEVAKSANISGD
jgi:tripartite-type tricarboxylate transporter receptor subunit TctC